MHQQECRESAGRGEVVQKLEGGSLFSVANAHASGAAEVRPMVRRRFLVEPARISLGGVRLMPRLRCLLERPAVAAVAWAGASTSLFTRTACGCSGCLGRGLDFAVYSNGLRMQRLLGPGPRFRCVPERPAGAAVAWVRVRLLLRRRCLLESTAGSLGPGPPHDLNPAFTRTAG